MQVSLARLAFTLRLFCYLRRLAADAVLAVRDLSLTPPLSEPWLGNAERLMRVANVSEMEKKLKKEGAPDATLWEGEELGLRYLLEDGKLNLTLRLLDEYVTWLAALGRPLSVSEIIVRCVYVSVCVAPSTPTSHHLSRLLKQCHVPSLNSAFASRLPTLGCTRRHCKRRTCRCSATPSRGCSR